MIRRGTWGNTQVINAKHAHKMAAQRMAALGTKLAVGTAKTATRLGAQTLGAFKLASVAF